MRYLPRTGEGDALRFVPASGAAGPARPGPCFGFEELTAWVERYAALMWEAGIRPGDRVCLYLPNSPELLVALFGNHLIGVITVPVGPTHTPREVVRFAERAGVRALLTHRPAELGELATRLRLLLGQEELWDALEAQQAVAFEENQDPKAPALLCFTSGTTAEPKGALLTHANLRSNLADLISVWQWTGDERLLLALPLSHVHGLGVGLHGWALTGCSLVLLERFDPEAVLECVGEHRCTLFMGVPTMYRRLLDAYEPGRHRLDSLRLLITGSAAMPVGLHRRCREVFGQTVLERYGMTETMMNTSNPLHRRKAGSVGLPLPSVELCLVDEDGRPIEGAGVPGEVWVRGPNVFAGYWDDPEATARSLVQGWFRTGDVGYRDGDGYLHLLGRRHLDFIKSGGYRIGAREVEEVLEAHPGVKEAAVVGVPDEDLGERVVAFVVPAAEAREGELLAYCRQRLARYKCPREFRFVESLPKGPTGKVIKGQLRR